MRGRQDHQPVPQLVQLRVVEAKVLGDLPFSEAEDAPAGGIDGEADARAKRSAVGCPSIGLSFDRELSWHSIAQPNADQVRAGSEQLLGDGSPPEKRYAAAVIGLKRDENP